MTIIRAEHALTRRGWESDVTVEVGADGIIQSVTSNAVDTLDNSGITAQGERVGLLLPAMSNLHSHAFQRAMAGLTERRGPGENDSFWTWRELMYKFLDRLQPADIEAIAAFAQMQMLESGYASVGEFHYVHHQPGGNPYGSIAELAERVVAAASQSGIGLTLLPVLYQQGGTDGRAVNQGQRRFLNATDQYELLYASCQDLIKNLSNDACLGVAPHSLRAVPPESLMSVAALADGQPVHIHIAEQQAEVAELASSYGQRPVEWLLDHNNVDQSWCLIHATHMTPGETQAFAASGATAGLCPVTESNLGDGIFNGVLYREAQGHWGIGTDSNIRISLSEELRTLEYSQRLREQQRGVLAAAEHSTGETLYRESLSGGARALQRRCGVIEAGSLADLLALDANAIEFAHLPSSQWIDSWLFAGDDSLVSDCWAAGRHVVSNGKHHQREAIETRYRATLKALLASL